MEQQFKLRKVALEDMRLLYEWANDSELRKNSFQTKPIEYAVHEKWFHEKLQDENSRMYLLMCDKENVGHIRVEIQGEAGIISYSISKENRGKGYSYRILQLLEEEIRNSTDVTYLIGNVKLNNHASQKAFLTLRYRARLEDGYISYRKMIQ